MRVASLYVMVYESVGFLLVICIFGADSFDAEKLAVGATRLLVFGVAGGVVEVSVHVRRFRV